MAAQYPGAAGTDANLFIAANNLSTSLSDNPLTIGATTVNVASTTGFPTAGYITIEAEAISYTGTTGTSFTGCTRGADGTAAASHVTGLQVYHDIVAAHHNVLKEEIKAIETDLVGSYTGGSTTIATTFAKYLKLIGGTLSGALAMGANKITGLANGTADTDAANFGQYKQTAQNILDNGGFEIWQRGTSFSAPASAAYTVDRWKTNTNTAASAVVSQETTTIDSGLDSMKVVISGSPAAKFWYVQQSIENYKSYASKTITVSVRVKSSVATSIRIGLYDGVTNPLSSYHTGGGGWETLSATIAVNAVPTELTVQLGMLATSDAQNGTYYFDSAMLIIGSEAVAFVPTNLAVDLTRCQRFYQRYGGNIGPEQILCGQCYSTTNWLSTLQFRVQMRIAPTATVTGTVSLFQVYDAAATVKNCATVVVNTISPSSCDIAGTVASGLVGGNATTLVTSTTAAYFEFTADL